MAPKQRVASATRSPELRERPLLIGVGAAAGSLPALVALASAMSSRSRASFVVVRNLGALETDEGGDGVSDQAQNDAMLVDELRGQTKMRVCLVEDRMLVEAGRLYVAPVGATVLLKKNRLRLVSPDDGEKLATPIDGFFHSLAEVRKAEAVGIVLSGAGSDGTLGLKAIAAAGGLTVAQAPESAPYDTMPRQAIATGVVDRILPPEAIAAELTAHRKHLRKLGRRDGDRKLERAITSKVADVAALLERQTSHNFLHYKTSTLVRRIRRRMQVERIPSVERYMRLLEQSEEERLALHREMLIGVTSFFRDPTAFEALSETVLRKLVRRRTSQRPIRIWVPGCATGKEAYSIAMLCREHIDEAEGAPSVQIFATDIDTRALETARRGSYPAEIAKSVTSERLERFFVRRGRKYQVRKEIREMCLFSPHNLIADPPFSALDLISCRNVLIYLGPHLQKKLIPVFHYALRPNGHLFLGMSENLTSHEELFRVVDASHRISQRRAVSTELVAPSRSELHEAQAPELPASKETNLTELALRIVLDEFAPQWAIVNEDQRIMALSSQAGKYLQLTGGEFHNNIIKMARKGLRVALRTALREAIDSCRRVEHGDVSLRVVDGVQPVQLTVQPMPRVGEDSGLFMVVFREAGGVVDRKRVLRSGGVEDAESIFEQLTRELAATKDDLESSIQNLEQVNEELKAGNEELMSMNEELHSANEELQTSREEVERTNVELARATADLENLLRSTAIATLFLDEQLAIRRFTPAASEIYNVLEGDVGRPIWHLTHVAKQMPDLPAVEDVRRSDEPIEDLVEMRDGRAFVRRVLPYRTLEGSEDGLVVTFTDVSAMQAVQKELHAATERLDVAWQAALGGVFEHDVARGSYSFHTRQWADILGYERDELPADEHLMEWIHAHVHVDDVDGLVSAYEQVVHGDEDASAVEARMRRKNGELIWVLATSKAVERSSDGTARRIVGVMVDISARKRAAAELAARNRLVALRADISASVTSASVEDALQRCCEAFVTHLDAAFARIWLTNGAGDELHLKASAGIYTHLDGGHAVVKVGEHKIGKIAESRKPHLTNDVQNDERVSNPEWAARERMVAFAGYPLLVDDRCVGVVAMFSRRALTDGLLLDLEPLVEVIAGLVERRRAQREIAGNELFLRHVLDNLFAFVGVLTPDGTLIEANRAPLDAAGIRREDVIGKKFWDCPWWSYSPKAQKLLQESVQRAAGGEATRYDARIRVAGNGRAWIDFQIAPLRDAHGRITHLIPSGMDISERRRAEQTLMESERRLRHAAAAAQFGAYVYDVATGELTGSQELYEIYGLSPEEPLDHRTIEERIHPDDREAFRRHLGAVLVSRSDEEYASEFRICHSDGTVRWVTDRGRVFFSGEDDERKAIQAAGMVVDVTDRKEAEMMRTRIAAIVDASADAIIGKTIDGTVTDWNRGAAELYGYSAEEMVGQNIIKIVPEDRRSELARIFTTLRAGETIKDMETIRVRKDGARRDISLTVSPIIRGRGAIYGASAVARDITDRKRNEQALRESERRLRLALAAADLGTFEYDVATDVMRWDDRARAIYGIDMGETPAAMLFAPIHADDRARVRAHVAEEMNADETGRATTSCTYRICRPDGEIGWVVASLATAYGRDPSRRTLRVIGAIADVTEHKQAELALLESDRRKDEFIAMLGHELRNPLAAIRNASELIKLVDVDNKRLSRAQQVLERQVALMARLVDGLLEVSRITRGKIDLEPQALDLAQILRRVAVDRQHEVRERDIDLVQELPSEPVWVSGDETRLVQIFDNLLGNAVKFTELDGHITVSLTIEGDDAVAVVQDDGMGIRVEHLARIFEPFQQERASGQVSAGGLGLGLALVKSLVALHGGTIEAHSEGKGTGARFTVRLPRIAAPKRTTQPAPESRAKARRIVVIDDNADAAALLRDLLTMRGHSVVVVDNGPEALAWLREHPADVVFCDIGMPEMDGYAIARAIRDEDDLRGLALVAVTGYGQAQDRQRSLEAGFNAHLTKPVDLAAMEETLTKLTKRSQSE